MYALGKQRLVSGAKAMASALVALCVASGLGACTPVPNAGPSPSDSAPPTATSTPTASSADPGGPFRL